MDEKEALRGKSRSGKEAENQGVKRDPEQASETEIVEEMNMVKR